MDPDYALFASVAEAGNLSAASRALGVSPAVVSKRLARLEARLGVTLAHRTTRRFSLSSAGAAFYADVSAIQSAIRTAEAKLSAYQEKSPTGRLHISAPTSFGRLHVAPLLAQFLDLYPRVDVQLSLSDAFIDLVKDDVDIAIRITSKIHPSLDKQRLATSRRVLCASRDYLLRCGAPKRLSDLSRHQLLAATGQLPWRLQGRDGLAVVKGRSRVRTNSSEVVRELCLTGAGVALRSLWDVGADLAAGRLTRILPAYEGSADAGVYAVYPRSNAPPSSVAALIAFLKTSYAPPPWE